MSVLPSDVHFEIPGPRVELVERRHPGLRERLRRKREVDAGESFWSDWHARGRPAFGQA